jgi:hypothetical protein
MGSMDAARQARQYASQGRHDGEPQRRSQERKGITQLPPARDVIRRLRTTLRPIPTAIPTPSVAP